MDFTFSPNTIHDSVPLRSGSAIETLCLTTSSGLGTANATEGGSEGATSQGWEHKRGVCRECSGTLVAQCSATPATVAATPPCIAKNSTADPLRRPLRCPLRRPLRHPLRRPLLSPPPVRRPSRSVWQGILGEGDGLMGVLVGVLVGLLWNPSRPV